MELALPTWTGEGVWRFHSLEVNAWTAADQVPWKGDLLMRPKPRNAAPPVAEHQR